MFFTENNAKTKNKDVDDDDDDDVNNNDDENNKNSNVLTSETQKQLAHKHFAYLNI